MLWNYNNVAITIIIATITKHNSYTITIAALSSMYYYNTIQLTMYTTYFTYVYSSINPIFKKDNLVYVFYFRRVDIQWISALNLIQS